MSGSGNKKKGTRSEGWEEAGLEFYQESYPSNPEHFDILQQNPKHLTTLLPSKQSRAVPATIRKRNYMDTRTFRRYSTSRHETQHTVGERSVINDVQVSMMPDLAEFNANEKTTWNEIMEIKAMAIPMSLKREMKSKLQSTPNLRLQGFEQFQWQKKKCLDKFSVRFEEFKQKMSFLQKGLKRIEGNFGTGVVAYFMFIKWLMLLNLAMFFLIFLAVVLPNILTVNPTNCPLNSTSKCCPQEYYNNQRDFQVVDLFQGTGKMETTHFFLGSYSNQIISTVINNTRLYYNLPLAYVSVFVACFLLSLFCIVRSASKGFRERLVENEGQVYHYSHILFGSWDFCIDNAKSADKKHDAIYQEIKNCLDNERFEEDRENRSRNEKTKLLVIRILVNLLVIVVLLGCAALIYFVFEYSTMQLQQEQTVVLLEEYNILELIYEFLPSIVIVMLNLVVPSVFHYLVQFENYRAVFIVRITLVRTVFLRLFSLCVLYASLYRKVSCQRLENECASSQCKTPLCWESFVGQQMYKLAITDFVIHLVMTFTVNYFRSRIGKLNNKYAKWIGVQTFDLPKHVLDIVYMQTVCWFGTFYAPLLPAMVTLILFLMFYVKKFACLVNSQPSLVVYRVSRSNSMFMVVLLVSFVFAFVPVAYAFAELQPSISCGPFRDVTAVWSIVTNAFNSTPEWVQNGVFFLSTAGFAVPLLVILCLTLYYYMAVTSANRQMVTVLKNQLVLEGHDKQFLLEKLSSFINQHKHRRQWDLLPNNERTVASN